jgi:hypothetical protein
VTEVTTGFRGGAVGVKIIQYIVLEVDQCINWVHAMVGVVGWWLNSSSIVCKYYLWWGHFIIIILYVMVILALAGSSNTISLYNCTYLQ